MIQYLCDICCAKCDGGVPEEGVTVGDTTMILSLHYGEVDYGGDEPCDICTGCLEKLKRLDELDLPVLPAPEDDIPF